MPDPIDEYMKQQQARPTILSRLLSILREHDDLKGCFRYNLFTHDIEHARDNFFISPLAKQGELLNDNDTALLRSYLTRSCNFSPSDKNISDAVIDVSMDNRYHPIKDYLEGLRWDGVKRLHCWLSEICGPENTKYISAVGRKMFIAAIKRIYEPGCQYDNMVILEGKQGIYKSRLVQAMGGKWWAPIELNVHDRKAMVENMRGKWILEVEEMVGFGKADRERLKAFLSCPSDRVRLSYGRRSFDFKRQCVLVATMNPEGDNRYFNDTENRRFWPVEVPDEHRIQLDAFIEIKDQLFAEALMEYKAGATAWMDETEVAEMAKSEQDKRRSVDPWEEIITVWLKDQTTNHALREVTSTQIIENCLRIPKERINSGISRRVAMIMRNLAWVRVRDSKGLQGFFYVAPNSPRLVNDWSE